MDPGFSDDPRTRAIGTIEALGLSAYAARTFVTLVSVRPRSDDEMPSSAETTIWESGETNSLVLVLKTMFTWELTDGPADL